MVVRRIREHVATHNWFAVAVDVVIVVLGVFLGTQVNNWNERRLEDERAKTYRARLITELDFDARQYAWQVAYYRRAREYGLQALAGLDGSAQVADRDFVIAAYQLTQTDTTQTKTGVFDEITASGMVDNLGDDEVQQLASDFYISVEVAQRSNEAIFPYRTLLREALPYVLQIRIRSECGDRNVYYKGRLVGVRLVVPCPMTIAPSEAAAAVRAVKSIPEIHRQMTRYIASLDEKLDNLDVARQQGERFRNRLMAVAGGSPS